MLLGSFLLLTEQNRGADAVQTAQVKRADGPPTCHHQALSCPGFILEKQILSRDIFMGCSPHFKRRLAAKIGVFSKKIVLSSIKNIEFN